MFFGVAVVVAYLYTYVYLSIYESGLGGMDEDITFC